MTQAPIHPMTKTLLTRATPQPNLPTCQVTVKKHQGIKDVQIKTLLILSINIQMISINKMTVNLILSHKTMIIKRIHLNILQVK